MKLLVGGRVLGDSEALGDSPGLGLLALAITAAASLAAATLVAAPARAADLPAPAPSYYPPVYSPALYDWTGVYFGGHVGAGLLDDSVSQAAAGALALSGAMAIGPVGVVGGGQAGVNYQFSHWVAGAEVSWSATNLNGSGTIPAPAPLTERSTSAPLWFSTVSGRLGYAFNDLLLYAKAGGGWMNVGYTQNTLAGGLVAAAQSIGAVRNGFVGGVGLEYALTENFSARLEYDYYDFGTRTYDFPMIPIVVAVRSNLNVLAIAVNYRFNWAGGGPIAAKY